MVKIVQIGQQPTRQTHISDQQLKKELKNKYASIKPLVWEKGHSKERGVNVSVRK